MTTTECCYVYFIAAGDDAIKIGISNEPEARVSEIQTGNHRDVRIVQTRPFANRYKARQFETLLHKRYKHRHLRGEWFNMNERDLFSETDHLDLEQIEQEAIYASYQQLKADRFDYAIRKYTSRQAHQFSARCGLCHHDFTPDGGQRQVTRLKEKAVDNLRQHLIQAHGLGTN